MIKGYKSLLAGIGLYLAGCANNYHPEKTCLSAQEIYTKYNSGEHNETVCLDGILRGISKTDDRQVLMVNSGERTIRVITDQEENFKINKGLKAIGKLEKNLSLNLPEINATESASGYILQSQ
ncbi:hypothetical protein J4476_04365 [Candidatus Woesearchaeota archaeon]|nr:MAG: hypothetical protein QT09_C0002G0025 [archaeon GW2011_AR18]MBS3161898.1 hypothetical protein [Candidatus Woesearchaeota archaeon]HIH26102.1 hypothetical protein [Nanoarchaeota archaeon]